MSSIVTTASKFQSRYEEEMIKDVKATLSGFCNTILNVNGATAQFHSELDCSYTLITVPKKPSVSIKVLTSWLHFYFKCLEVIIQLIWMKMFPLFIMVDSYPIIKIFYITYTIISVIDCYLWELFKQKYLYIWSLTWLNLYRNLERVVKRI